MTIEIRPNAVRTQIHEKQCLLDAMERAVNEAYKKVDLFCNTEKLLDGAGYAAARGHMGLYKDYCFAVQECIEMTRRADSQVISALGVFGGANRVSEQEYLEKQQNAWQEASELRSRAENLEWNRDPFDFFSTRCANSLRSLAWIRDRQADFAGSKLSEIYSYCEQTNGLYGGDLGKLTDAISAGAQSFSSCVFDATTGHWEKVDSSWCSDEIKEIVDNNVDVLLFKGYGDVDRALLIDPIANPIADWWEANGTTIANVSKIAFGALSVVGGIALIASGVGAPAGIAALVGGLSGAADFATGIEGLFQGREVDWEKELARGAASVLGGDPDKAELVINGITTVASLYNVSKLPANVGKFVDSAKNLVGLSKTLKAGETATNGFEAGAAIAEAGNTAKAGIGIAKRNFASDASHALGSVCGSVDLSEKALDILVSSKKERGVSNANYENAAFRYGY